MSACPNCGRKLSWKDWRPNCPQCGVNLIFSQYEERFLEDAKNAELGHARLRVSVAKIKAAFLGSKLAVARLVVCLLPLAALLLPVATAMFRVPFVQEKQTVSLIGVIQMISGGSLKLLLSLQEGAHLQAVFSALGTVLIGFAATALFAVLLLAMTVLCFVSVKRCAVAACCICVLGVLTDAVALVLAGRFVSLVTAQGGALVTAQLSFGCYGIAAAFIIAFVLNLLVAKRGIPVKFREGDLYRVEVAAKLKRAELQLKDLPQPIWESEEEREKRLAMEREWKAKFQPETVQDEEGVYNEG